MKLVYYSVWILIRFVSKLFFRIRVSGKEHFPRQGGFIVATNHISYFDPPLVGSWSPRELYYLAKAELFRLGPIGWLLRGVNALPVRRATIDRAAIEVCVETIRSGRGLLVFPEGTRSKSAHFLEPKAGIGMIASQAGCLIIPGYIKGSNRLGACFLGREDFSITFGEPLPAKWVSSIPADKDGYREIATTVMERIVALRDQVVSVKSKPPKAD
ncbi:MAG: 1-acyl-sn-glycerol-3-phosphate acyltransferase [candidate division Zixibacteria bacterium]|nr:1-acyl-sn-glycerol-3-phosphate acyltransferase [candidate division Zixibacteria bacterium]